MKWIVLALAISLVGCELSPEYRKLKEEQRQKAWDGPCAELAVKKEKLIHVTCTNKDHKVAVEGDLVICRCKGKK